MSRFLLFTLIISFIGYSQNSIQQNHPNFKDGLPQDLVEKMKPINLEFGVDKMMDFNPIKKRDLMESKSFQRVVMLENNNSNTLRLDSIFTLRYHWTSNLPDEFLYFSRNINEKSFIRFDDGGNITEHQTYVFNTTSQSFVTDWKNELTYDERGNVIIRIQYNWNSESLVPGSKNEFTFDDNGNQTLRIKYNWNSESQSFVPSEKKEHTFDENGNLTQEVWYSWNTELQFLVPLSNTNFSYDENFRLILYINSLWNTESQSFVPKQKNENTYFIKFI